MYQRFEFIFLSYLFLDYQFSLSMDASVKVGASASIYGVEVSTSFSASTGFKTASRSIEKEKNSFFLMKSYCLLYVVSFDEGKFAKETPTEAFEKHCEALPSVTKKEDINEDVRGQWNEFFKDYGTHYIHKVILPLNKIYTYMCFYYLYFFCLI